MLALTPTPAGELTVAAAGGGSDWGAAIQWAASGSVQHTASEIEAAFVEVTPQAPNSLLLEVAESH